MTASPSPLRRHRATLLLLSALTAGNAAAFGSDERAAIERFLAAEAAAAPGQVSVQVDAPADGSLPPCAALQPFLPAGAKAWGRVTVGIRCPGERPWTRFLMARVSVEGPYLVAARPLPAGHTLQAEDLAQRTGDLAAMPAALLTAASQAAGSIAVNAIAAGTPLRSPLLRQPPAVRQGQWVRLTAAGPGFVASTQAQALTNAPAGATLQVKTLEGRVLSGIAGENATVSLP